MTPPLHPGYRFATEAQWQACLFAGADRSTVDARRGLRPFAPYGLPPTLFETIGAHAPALSDMAELLWRDDAGSLQRLPDGAEQPRSAAAPTSIRSSKRMVAAPGTLWTVGADGAVEAFDIDSLSRLFSVDLGGLGAIDIAGDGHDGVYALLASNDDRFIVHVDCAGRIDAELSVGAAMSASALVFLAHPARLVLLGSDATKLYWFDTEGALERTIIVAALRPCFDLVAIGSDGCARLFLAGTDGKAVGGGHQVLMLDTEGNVLGTVPLGNAPTGITAGRSQLLVTTGIGLARFDPTILVPQGGGEIRAAVLTPLLRSPSQPPRRWLRIEARVALPAGCSVEISYASADDPELIERLSERLRDTAASPARRLDDWRRALAPRTFVFHGDGQSASDEERVLSAPLHDVTADLLWVQVELIAAPGASIPHLSQLSILYPGATLIEHLPAIYRSGELEAGDFLRALVGVLEAGTQQLDATISDLGRRIHPATAEGEWLDYVANWLGLPWDDGLSLDQKRGIVGRASLIANGYGARAGLETLLEGLIPGQPRRFRLVDVTADYGIATLGGGECQGTRLPAILSGLPQSASELGNKAILGHAKLPCGDSEPEAARFLGCIRVDVMADAGEREAWSPWLGSLIDSMLPATTRAELRWLGPDAFEETDRLTEGLRLESEPLARLGTDSVTGTARLGGRGRTVLPGRLSDDSTLH